MNAIGYVMVGMVIIAILTAVVILVPLMRVSSLMANSRMAIHPTGSTDSTSEYRAELSDGQKMIIRKLVIEVAQMVRGTDFTKEAIERMIGTHPDFDQVMYFHFRRLLGDGSLTIANLSNAIRG